MPTPTSDEQSIRNVIAIWLRATAAGDVDARMSTPQGVLAGAAQKST